MFVDKLLKGNCQQLVNSFSCVIKLFFIPLHPSCAQTNYYFTKTKGNEKNILLFSVLAVAAMTQAKDRTIVVKGSGSTIPGKTEVTIHEGEDSDTITVTPSSDVTTITVTVRDLDGVLIQHDVLSAAGDNLELSTPSPDKGFVITLRDDDGVIYQEYE